MTRRYGSRGSIVVPAVLMVLTAWFTVLSLSAFGEAVYTVVDGRPVTFGRVLGGFVGLVVGVAAGWVLRHLLTTPFTVLVADDGWCEFRSVVRRTRLDASSIAWVRPKRDSDTNRIIGASVGYRVGYSDKRLSLELPRRRLASFVDHLQHVNPGIRVDHELTVHAHAAPKASSMESPLTCERLVFTALDATGAQAVHDPAGLTIGRVVAEAGWLVLSDLRATPLLHVDRCIPEQGTLSSLRSACPLMIADERGRPVASLLFRARKGSQGAVHDAHGQYIGAIETHLLHPWTFTFKDATGTEVGRITHERTNAEGLWTQSVTVAIRATPELHKAMLGFAIHHLDIVSREAARIVSRYQVNPN